MNEAMYAVINPVVKLVLRSPLHGLMSRNTLLLEFKGRKSGQTYSTPVSYHATDGRVHCFTERRYKWWRNLCQGDEVGLTLRGRHVVGRPTVLTDGSASVQKALHDFLLATPRDAPHAGVALDAQGCPDSADIEEASKRLVFISIELADEHLDFQASDMSQKKCREGDGESVSVAKKSKRSSRSTANSR